VCRRLGAVSYAECRAVESWRPSRVVGATPEACRPAGAGVRGHGNPKTRRPFGQLGRRVRQALADRSPRRRRRPRGRGLRGGRTRGDGSRGVFGHERARLVQHVAETVPDV